MRAIVLDLCPHAVKLNDDNDHDTSAKDTKITQKDTATNTKDTATNTKDTATNTKDTKLAVAAVSGGITNKLSRVASLRNGKMVGGVLVRIYGGEGLIDRNVECQTFAALSKFLVRPKYLGSFKNGRLEEWLEGYRPLDRADLPKSR